MKRRVLRAAVALADEAGRRIHEAGRVPPPRADLIAALLPVARNVEAAAREHHRASLWLAETSARADAAAERAAGAVASLTDEWIAQAPPSPRWAVFDPARHRAALVTVPLCGESESAGAAG
jgi:hypothetical protein